MVRLEDIARQAGVSHSTVSRALAGSPLISVETRDRIQKLAAESGYQVNQVARNLKVRSTSTIGLIVPEVSNPYYPKLVQHVADAVKAAGFSLQLHLSGSEQDAEAQCVASLREHRADGILLVTGERGIVAREQVLAMSASKTPVVLMGWVDGAEEFNLVTGDDAKGGYALGRHLVELGHRRIALLGKPPHRGPYDRLVGFRRALEEGGVPLSETLALEAASDEEVYVGVTKLLALDDPPTAIFAYQDSLAALTYKHLGDAGVSIPQDMTVVGFDDLDLATYLTPRLTTVGGHIEPLSAAFVDLLLVLVRGQAEESLPRQIVLTPQLIVRSSCTAPRQRPLTSSLSRPILDKRT